MKNARHLVLLSAVSLFILNSGLAFAEENTQTPAQEPVQAQAPAQAEAMVSQEQMITPETTVATTPVVDPAVTPEVTPAAAEPETQWIWGEVVSVDIPANEISVKYLDYETDNEKEMKIGVNEKTTYENAGSINDLKAGNTISVDYVSTPDGKNTAKNISIEKPEEATVPPVEPPVEAPAAPAPEAAPVNP